MIIKPQIHTVFFLVGPSGSGKSYLAKQMRYQLRTALEIPDAHFVPIVKIISSDDTRTEILGDTIEDKIDPSNQSGEGFRFKRLGTEYMHTSAQAFELMRAKLKAYTQYPYNAQFIIIDATNFSADSRKEFLDISYAAHYANEMIVLDYKDREEFLKFLPEDHPKKLVFDQIDRLHSKFYPDLNRNDYAFIHKLRRKDFSGIEFDIQNLDLFKRSHIGNDIVHIIPDLHGCMTEFKQALQNLGYTIKDGKIEVPEKLKYDAVILLGDLIDKGPDSKEIIHFVHTNRDFFKICLGNHENFVYKMHKGLIKEGSTQQEIIDKYFTTTKEFEGDEETLAKLVDLVENYSTPFVRNKYLIANHAPCSVRYLGKVDSKSRLKQRNFRIPRVEKEGDTRPITQVWEEGLKFWEDEAQYNTPMNFSGHMPFQKIVRVKNRYLIDGGLVHNGGLNVVTVNPFAKGKWVRSQYIKRGEAVEGQVEALHTIFNKGLRKMITVDDLEGRELVRLKWLAHNKVNFISGTMSPADKDEARGELESLEKGLDYYRQAGEKKVVLQQKFMGSRCQVYLDRDLDKCMATSRQGFEIRPYDPELKRGVDLLPVFKKLHEKHLKHMERLEVQTYVMDGELMPWSALGEDLINGTFKAIGYAIQSEYDLLKDVDFEGRYKALIKDFESTTYKDDSDRMKKQDLIEKYSHLRYANFKCIQGYQHQDLNELAPFIDTYHRQIELYGAKGDIHFKPFAMLKEININGSEFVYSNYDNEAAYQLCYPDENNGFAKEDADPILVLDLSDPNCLQEAEDFYNNTTLEKKMEGICIKPWIVHTGGVAPALKVRNHDYLTIIYGYDFKTSLKYQRLLRQKSIRSKVRTSIEEFDIGMKLLKIPRAEISQDNSLYANSIAQMIAEEKRETHIDPRL